MIDQIALGDRIPSVAHLDEAILLLETSEDLPSADHQVTRWVRTLRDRGAARGRSRCSRRQTASQRTRFADATLTRAYAPGRVVETKKVWLSTY